MCFWYKGRPIMVTDVPVVISANVVMPSVRIGISQQPGWLVVPSLSSLTAFESKDRVPSSPSGLAMPVPESWLRANSLGSHLSVRGSLFFCVLSGLGFCTDSTLGQVCFSQPQSRERSLSARSPLGLLEQSSPSSKAWWMVPYHQVAFIRLKNPWMDPSPE